MFNRWAILVKVIVAPRQRALEEELVLVGAEHDKLIPDNWFKIRRHAIAARIIGCGRFPRLGLAPPSFFSPKTRQFLLRRRSKRL